jgi:hypothetical protein
MPVIEKCPSSFVTVPVTKTLSLDFLITTPTNGSPVFVILSLTNPEMVTDVVWAYALDAEHIRNSTKEHTTLPQHLYIIVNVR